MIEFDTLSLKPENQKIVMGNQQNNNPNSDNKPDDNEIGMLLANSEKNTSDDLVIGTDENETVEEANDLPTLAFQDMDLNKDGKISEEERNTYKSYLQLKKKNEIDLKEFKQLKSQTKGAKIAGFFAGAVGGAIGAISVAEGIDTAISRNDQLFHKFKSIYSRSREILVKYDIDCGERKWITESFTKYKPLSKTLIALGGIAGAAVLGLGVYKLVSRFCKSCRDAKNDLKQVTPQLEEEKAKLKELDEQYRHVNTAYGIS